MRPTVEQLEAFYASPLGRRVASHLVRQIEPHLTRRASDRVLAIGYASPFLGSVASRAERVIQAMPQRQGVVAWPAGQPNGACLVDEQRLPFADALFDQILIAHALEFTDPARRFLREVWRILAPAGRLIVLAPNRAGLWTHFERTPFGNGRPFGFGQLNSLLDDALFAVSHHETMLVMPPLAPLIGLERPAHWLMPRLGGVHLAVATKVDGLMPVGRERRTVARLAEA